MMCDCVRSTVIVPYGGPKSRKLGLERRNLKPGFLPLLGTIIGFRDCSSTKAKDRDMKRVKNFRVFGKRDNPFSNHRVCQCLGQFGSEWYDFGSELRLKEEGDELFELGLQNGEEKLRDFTMRKGTDDMGYNRLKNGEAKLRDFTMRKEADDMGHNSLKEVGDEHFELGLQNGGEKLRDFTMKKEADDMGHTRLKEEGDEYFELGLENGEEKLRDFTMGKEADGMGHNSLKREKHHSNEFDLFNEDVRVKKSKGGLNPKQEMRSRKQLMKRSSMLAKQVIGIQSALSLGFVSQLWVDSTSWAVLEVEVKPNLLSSESGKFLLEDSKQVGDVVLVQDDSVLLNEFRTVGLETLVGYNVVTLAQRNLGKVRGYTFNLNSGAVESLELDAFGYSIIPSSLVSTYALFTEDVMEVDYDTIVVHEAAASRLQRLTKAFLGRKNMEISSINLKYRDPKEESIRPVKGQKSRRKFSKRKLYPGTRDLNDDLELPMDYM